MSVTVSGGRIVGHAPVWGQYIRSICLVCLSGYLTAFNLVDHLFLKPLVCVLRVLLEWTGFFPSQVLPVRWSQDWFQPVCRPLLQCRAGLWPGCCHCHAYPLVRLRSEAGRVPVRAAEAPDSSVALFPITALSRRYHEPE